jgi:diguanylate cyclase (GGDEF)-like protein
VALQKERNTWGVAQFAIALAISAAVIVLWLRIPLPAESILQDRLFILLGLGAAIFAGWFGYSSYPRVHNFKVYAMGVGVATVSFVSVLLVVLLPMVVSLDGGVFFPATILLSYLSLLFVFVVTVIVPEYLGFHFTRRMTTVIVGIILFWYLVGLITPVVREFLAVQLIRVGSIDSTAFWGLSSVAAAVLFLSLFTESHSLGIGGIHAGGVLLLSVGWLTPGSDILLHGMVITALPVLVALGTLIHWFRRLENRASYDPLLRIYNREWCDRVLKEQSPLDTRPECTIGLIDLDHFKLVNDTYGHDAGDSVLREAAQRIRNIVVPHGSVGRYGGEELLIVLPRHGEKEARPLLEKIRAALKEKPIGHDGTDIPVTCSIGFAVRTEAEQPLGTVLGAADKALYAAKDNGRDMVKLGRLTRREK